MLADTVGLAGAMLAVPVKKAEEVALAEKNGALLGAAAAETDRPVEREGTTVELAELTGLTLTMELLIAVEAKTVVEAFKVTVLATEVSAAVEAKTVVEVFKVTVLATEAIAAVDAVTVVEVLREPELTSAAVEDEAERVALTDGTGLTLTVEVARADVDESVDW